MSRQGNEDATVQCPGTPGRHRDGGPPGGHGGPGAAGPPQEPGDGGQAADGCPGVGDGISRLLTQGQWTKEEL